MVRKQQRRDQKGRRGPRRDIEVVFDPEKWTPTTDLGRRVKSGEITNIDDILDRGLTILEKEIVDMLLPNLKTELLEVGQSKGKFGGGKRSIWRQTQKKSKEYNSDIG